MSDIGQLVDYNNSVITPSSINSIGPYLLGINTSISTGTASPSANQAIYIPFSLGSILTIQKAFWFNGATTGNGTVDIGVYDSQGNQLVHSGATATAGASSVQTVSLTSTALEAGNYYMAFVASSISDNFAAHSNFFISSNPMSRGFGAYSQTSASPLPATATFSTIPINFCVIMGLTALSVV